MHKKNVLVFVIIPILLQCINNVPETGKDLIEFESVWQYLKAYSIYQDECLSGSDSNCEKRLRDSPFDYDSPSEMMDLLYDTLKGQYYTRYFQSEKYNASGLSKRQSDRYVKFYRLTPATAMIMISEFATDITFSQFKEEVKKINSDYKNCIVDLMDNGGGDLNELDSIIEWFLPAHKKYILARERKYDEQSKSFKTFDYHPLETTRDASPYLTGKKIVVLMNGHTASAAEILAAALKEGAGAILAGQTSYGKAIGQIRLSRRGRKSLQITFLQLKGIGFGAYQNVGIQPDSILSKGRSRENYERVVRMVEPDFSGNFITLPAGLLGKSLVEYTPEGYVNIVEE